VPYAAGQEIVFDFASLIPATADRVPAEPADRIERVTSAVPWGRGMIMVDGELMVLSRGRHRGEGGPAEGFDDSAGIIWRVDPASAEAVVPGEPAGETVRTNATPWILPTSPPFHLYDPGTPPEADELMGRPYCALAFDGDSRNVFVCAYAGAELPDGFRKHRTDAVLRHDLRTGTWHVVEQHDPRSTAHPHHDPRTNPPPHGWADGADGCAVAGDFLYVTAKDNHLVIQYDLGQIRETPDAPAPASRPVIGPHVLLSHPGGQTRVEVLGPSAVAVHDGWLYVGYRTSSVVIRFRLDEDGRVINDGPLPEAQLIGVFQPFDRDTRRSGNLYDLALDDTGDLYVSMGTRGRVWRFKPDPARPFFGNDAGDRDPDAEPFVDLPRLLGKPASLNNILIGDDGFLYVSSRTNDLVGGQTHGTIYRVPVRSPSR
jgi:hypothetical protein